MEPRTKIEEEIVRLSDTLPAMTAAQRLWAERNVFDDYIILSGKRKSTCSSCMRTFEMKDAEGKQSARCPHCGRRLPVKRFANHRIAGYGYFGLTLTLGRWQVVRCFRVYRVWNRFTAVRHFEINEVVRWFYDPASGKERVLSCGQKGLSLGYVDTGWNFHNPLSLKGCLASLPLYRQVLSSMVMYPCYSALSVLRRNGFRGKFHGVSPDIFLIGLLHDPHVETLVKAGYGAWIGHYISSPMGHYWPSIRICIRNGYNKSGRHLDLLLDYWSCLFRLGRDMRNASYVCPADISRAHDEATARIQRRENEERRRKQEMDMAEAEREYSFSKGKFLGLCFRDGDLRISVLPSVAAFKAEGDAMHHCVYACRYYAKSDSVVFSATVKGKRMETVEVDIRNFRVLQSYGAHNTLTKYHGKILDVIRRNMDKIRKVAKAA